MHSSGLGEHYLLPRLTALLTCCEKHVRILGDVYVSDRREGESPKRNQQHPVCTAIKKKSPSDFHTFKEQRKILAAKPLMRL